MRAIIQRVSEASVLINNENNVQISKGFLVLIGIEELDETEDVNYLTQKIVNMRIFPDDEGKMNRSLLDINGEILIISQFTLHAIHKKRKST
jgi:D-aminoacyl-tRNA deacylase